MYRNTENRKEILTINKPRIGKLFLKLLQCLYWNVIEKEIKYIKTIFEI